LKQKAPQAAGLFIGGVWKRPLIKFVACEVVLFALRGSRNDALDCSKGFFIFDETVAAQAKKHGLRN
jgi:hypothetical protein